jgi:hypothetical protein
MHSVPESDPAQYAKAWQAVQFWRMESGAYSFPMWKYDFAGHPRFSPVLFTSILPAFLIYLSKSMRWNMVHTRTGRNFFRTNCLFFPVSADMIIETIRK